VTELMQGSLKDVLRDIQRPLDWSTRLRIADDIAKGMNYLHLRGAVHRDLKVVFNRIVLSSRSPRRLTSSQPLAVCVCVCVCVLVCVCLCACAGGGLQADNCFVDAALRVKVADFGTGRIAAKLAGHRRGRGDDTHPSTHHDGTSSSEWCNPVEAWSEGDKIGRTLSVGVGSLLWMAPEAIRGSRITEGQAPALDVYVRPRVRPVDCSCCVLVTAVVKVDVT
jgi:serine/threonine protein kinase